MISVQCNNSPYKYITLLYTYIAVLNCKHKGGIRHNLLFRKGRDFVLEVIQNACYLIKNANIENNL